MISPRIDASVSTPMPPISTPTNTNTWPIGDQKVAMSTVERPVTQITETAVKRASTKGACSPDVVAIGSENSTVKMPTRPPKTRTAKRAALRDAKSPIASRMRAGSDSRCTGLVRIRSPLARELVTDEA